MFILLVLSSPYLYIPILYVQLIWGKVIIKSFFQKQPSRGTLRKNPCRSMISIILQNNFIEITLWHGCSPVNLLHVFWILFYKNTSGRLLLFFTTYVLLSSSIVLVFVSNCALNIQYVVRSSHRRCSIKKLFLKISQYSHQNNRPVTFLKRYSNAGVFLWILQSF